MLVGALAQLRANKPGLDRLVSFEGCLRAVTDSAGFTSGIDKGWAGPAALAAPTSAVPLCGGFCWLPDPGRVYPMVEVTAGRGGGDTWSICGLGQAESTAKRLYLRRLWLGERRGVAALEGAQCWPGCRSQKPFLMKRQRKGWWAKGLCRMWPSWL